MEQEQLDIPFPQTRDVSERLKSLVKKAFEIRQMQLLVMKDIEEKYTSLPNEK